MLINPPLTLENFGGKGYQLSLLKNICLVPEFFAICFENPNEIDDHKVQEEIIRVYDSYKFDYVSIRSSATVEDSNIASFAGMFETKLNVTSEKLIYSIQEVFESSRSQRVDSYCKLNEVDVNNIKVRIIVQRMVNSKTSGVCITKDLSNSDSMLIEACWGLGETLVNGNITPDTYVVNRSDFSIKSLSIGYQKEMIAPFKDGILEVPFHLRNAKKLKDSELSKLSELCLLIEKEFNYQIADIEWAFDRDILYILQARPFVGKL
jgi:pyruvate,water dikinase